MAGHYGVHSTIQAMQTPDGARLSLDIAPVALVVRDAAVYGAVNAGGALEDPHTAALTTTPAGL
jgi:hypothetical protein